MSQPWQQSGHSRPRYPPIQTPQHGGYEMRTAPPLRHQQGPMSPARRHQQSPISPSRGPPPPYMPSRPPPPTQQSSSHGQPRSQYQPHPNMYPQQRGGQMRTQNPRPSPGMAVPSHPPPMRPGHAQPGPGPNYRQQPSRQRGPPPEAHHQMRSSTYTNSMYSTNGTPRQSPNAPQTSTFQDPYSSSPRQNNSNNNRSTKGRASSFYADNPFMDKIPEDANEGVSPRSRRGSGSSEFEGYPSGVVSPLGTEQKGLDGIIAASQGARANDQGLVRQASMGKRQRAALTDVRYSDHRSVVPSVLGETHEDQASGSDDSRSVARSSTALGTDLAPYDSHMLPATPSSQGTKSSSNTSQPPPRLEIPPIPTQIGGSWPLRTPISPTEDTSPVSPPDARLPHEAANPTDSTVSDIDPRAPIPRTLSPPQSRFSRDWRDHQRGPSQMSTNDDDSNLLPQRNRSLKDRVGNKAPPTIDVAAVKTAEARGSMTSLPGLLNRALRLASNLERGKTSSIQSDYFGNDILRDIGERGKSTTSLNTIMLNSKQYPFPTTREIGKRSSMFSEKWPRPAPMPPSHLRHQSYNALDAAQQDRRRKASRRCCGLPLWLFLLLLFGAIIIIVLAVVLPVVFIVIPKDRAKPPPPPPPPATCANTHSCANGGIGVTDIRNNCQCLCTGRFSGANCSQTSVSCGSIPAQGMPNAAIGNALPVLINNAVGSYQVPLNATTILTAFAAGDVNCDMQNTLVAIAPASQKVRRDGPESVLAAILPTTTVAPDPQHMRIHRRQNDAVTGSNGLVFAGASSTSASDAMATSGPSSGITQQYSDTNHINFAKTAILYVLQVSQRLEFAISAGQKIQPFFNGVGGGQGTNPQYVDMGNGFTLDLVDMKVSGDGQSAGQGA